MDESRFLLLADQTFDRIEKILEPIDPDVVDYESTGDVLQLSFPNGTKCVINTQRPTRQIWLAAKTAGWHFGYEETSGRWIDERGSGMELFACIAQVIRENAGLELELPA